MAERGPSPYQVWPFPDGTPLTPGERYTLLTNHRDDDGLVFLSLEDIAIYAELRAMLYTKAHR